MKSIHKVVLVILDGWGYRAEKKGNAIAQALTPHYSKILGEYPNGLINASSHYVGLPEGVMGNSEVGHMNIGSGRPVLQDQVRINQSIDNGDFFKQPLLQKISQTKNKIHLVGLVSAGNVHSSEKHYLSLLDFFHQQGVAHRVVFHAIMDGRDTPPKSGVQYLTTLLNKVTECGATIGSVSGRFYAMDRDTRSERTELAYHAIALGVGEKSMSPLGALEKAYENGETDEFMKPTVMVDASGNPRGKMNAEDWVLCFNFRADRMRQLCKAFMGANLQLNMSSFTTYDQTFNFPTLYQPQSFEMSLGELIEAKDLHQFRTAETEKYAHVTFFFNCGREAPFKNEERVLIPSPKVRTYDLQPEMNSVIVTEGVVRRIHDQKDSLIVVNYAQPDMVGHTGNFDAAISAVEATDRALGAIVEAALDNDYNVIITADHGNIEMMIDPVTGEPHTAHTLNPVPVIFVGSTVKKYRVRSKGALCDIAPSILQIMGLVKPAPMTGDSLLI